MAVSFFPFNSIVVNGVADRTANAENLAAYLAGFFSDGVIMQANTALQVAVDSGMDLQILAGTGNIKGKTILNTTAASITIEAASATMKRIDRVIFRLDENNRLMEFDVLKGTAASSPTAPALTRSGGIYEMCLAEVLVPAGATSILASYITDTRSDSSKCGIASIPPHMQDIAHGGTGATTAAAALKNLGLDSIGKFYEQHFDATAIPVGTSKALASLTLPAGTYVVEGSSSWNVDNRNMYIMTFIRDVTANRDIAMNRGVMIAGGGLMPTAVVKFDVESTIIMYAYWGGGSGSTRHNSDYLRAVRVK